MNASTLRAAIGNDQQAAVRRALPGAEGHYSITPDGRLWSHYSTGCWMKLHLSKCGYWRCRLFIQKQKREWSIARLVLMAYVGPPPTPQHEANHINGNKRDNRVENLEWTTRVENQHHACLTGLHVGVPRIVTIDGVSKPLAEWPRHESLRLCTAHKRVFFYGWEPALALATPAGKPSLSSHPAPDTPRPGQRRRKLTEAQVRAIRADGRRPAQIASDYGLSPGYVDQLRAGRGRAWPNLQ